jgi:carbon storage regulator
MLVLSRKKGEAIVLGQNIEVVILDIGADTIKIGIAAPKEVQIVRKELLASVTQSNLESVNHSEGITALAEKLKKIKNNSSES